MLLFADEKRVREVLGQVIVQEGAGSHRGEGRVGHVQLEGVLL